MQSLCWIAPVGTSGSCIAAVPVRGRSACTPLEGCSYLIRQVTVSSEKHSFPLGWCRIFPLANSSQSRRLEVPRERKCRYWSQLSTPAAAKHDLAEKKEEKKKVMDLEYCLITFSLICALRI